MSFLDTLKGWFGTQMTVDSSIILGEELLDRGKGAEAEQRFRWVLKQEPQHRRAGRGLLQAFLLQGKSEAVIDFHDQLSQTERLATEDSLYLALALEAGSLKIDGYMAWLYLPRSGTEWIEGIRDLCKRYAKCGVFASSWVEACLQSFLLEEAEQALKQMRDAQPALPEDRVAWLHAKRDAAHLKEAPEIARLLEECSNIEDPMEKVRRLEPMASSSMDIAPLQYDTGLALSEAGQFEKAIRYMSRAVGINPYWANAWMSLGWLALQEKRYIRARACFFRVLQLKQCVWLREVVKSLDAQISQHSEWLHCETGLDRLSIGDIWGSVVGFRDAVERAPDDFFLKFLLGRSLFYYGQFEQSLSYLQMAWMDDPSCSKEEKEERRSFLEKAMFFRGVELVQENEFEEAIELFEEFFEYCKGFSVLESELENFRLLHNNQLSVSAYLLYIDAHPFHEEPLPRRIELFEQSIREESTFWPARLEYPLLQGV